ncbi:MAG: spheroidene monooxygenase [Polaromonas sp.]|nr:spheroidene monooxygenase [Polaromonas sp.]
MPHIQPFPAATMLLAPESAAGQVAVFLLADIQPAHRFWGYARFVVQRFFMRDVAGLVFSKVMGSGFEGGFGLRPSGSRQALFCLFDDEASADQFLVSSIARAYASRSREFCTAKLSAYSCKGTWAGRTLDVTASAPTSGPIATLTRASIKPLSARRFWRMQPASEVALNQASGCLLATGVGEAPFFRQATFSLWTGADAMNAYARTGAHLAAIQASNAGGFFSESMFARFIPLGLTGSWRGQHYS